MAQPAVAVPPATGRARIRRIRTAALVAGAVLLVAAFGWLFTTRGPLAAVVVQTGRATRADLSPGVFGIGTVDARVAYVVGPIAPGRVLRVLVDQGDAVKTGQLLAEMDPVDMDRRAQAAQSARSRSLQLVQVADAQVAEAASRAELARLGCDRDLRLFEQHVVSKEALDTSTHLADAAEAALAAARASAAAARQDAERMDAEVRGIGSQSDSLKLVSPADCVVVSREAEPGTTVVAGQAVLRLVVPGSLWVRARIDQSRAHGIEAGQRATIVLRSRPDAGMPGRVARIEMQSDPVTEERVVDVGFDPQPAGLYVGELAEVTIQLPAITGALVVPSAAITREGGRPGVWRDVDGRARFSAVTIGSQGHAGLTEIRSGLSEGDGVIVYTSAQLADNTRISARDVEGPVINLAHRDVANHLGRYLLTGLGLGLLIGITLTMAGVYRGMVDDARVLLRAVGADIWVVQQNTLGPFAEPSSLQDDVYRSIEGLSGVAETGSVAYLTMQVNHAGRDARVMLAGFTPGRLGGPAFLTAGRPIARDRYEAVADARTGLLVGDRIRIRRNDFTVVGLTGRMVSSSGDPMVFIPLKDAQEAQFLGDNAAIVNDRNRLAANPAVNRPGQPGVLDAVEAIQATSHRVNAVLVRLEQGWDPRQVADDIERWKHLTVYTSTDMEDILVAKLIATAARQIGLFLIILAVVSAAIVAFIIYTMTLGKIKEIAVLKLIGTRDRTIAAMILQEALGLGAIGFLVGKFAATLWAPVFPKYVLLETDDAMRAFAIAMVICALASVVAIRAALRIDPAEAIGG